MRKRIAAVVMAAALAGGINAAFVEAKPAPDNPGLCNAKDRGNKNGWVKNGTPPPFRHLACPDHP